MDNGKAMLVPVKRRLRECALQDDIAALALSDC
jgi:hypothetical protein